MKLLTCKEYAEHSGLPFYTVRRYCRECLLPHLQLGRVYKIDADRADAILLDIMASKQPKMQKSVPAKRQSFNFLEALKNI